MFVIVKKQRVCTALSIVSGSPQELGLVKGTLGARKVLLAIYGGNAAGATLTSPGVRFSWDGSTNPAVVDATLSATFESTTTRDVNALTAAQAVAMTLRPTDAYGLIQFPALNPIVTPTVTTLVTVDAWVFYDVDASVYMRHVIESPATYQPLLPS